MSDSREAVEQVVKTVADLPMWLIILLAMASGLTGEMMRASTLSELTWKQIACRILMRFGAGGLAGIGTFMLAFSLDAHPYMAAGLCIFVGMTGGDVAATLFERYAAKRLGVPGSGQGPASSG